MPRYTRRSTRSHRGGSIMKWLKTKALPFIKKHQLVSKGLKWAGKTFGKPAAANQLGYGRRRGGALRMAGGRRRGGALRM